MAADEGRPAGAGGSTARARPRNGGGMSSKFRQYRFLRPPDACEIVLVRHGESAEERPGRRHPLLDGQADPELHEEGTAQAQLVADRLEREDVSAIYATPLRRTLETASPLAERRNQEILIEPDLREVHLGEWEGVFRQRVADGDPVLVRMAQEERWDLIPGAEPAEEFASRVRAAMTRIAIRHEGELVVVFTHGGVIGQTLATATGASPFAFIGSDNASISHIVVHGERWVVRRYNDTTHLRPKLAHDPQPLT